MSSGPRFIRPREHGAWSMLLLPFAAGLLVADARSWLAVPAALAAISLLFVREPLIVVARQYLVWRDQRPETPAAKRTLAYAGTALLIAGAILFAARASWPLVALGAGGTALLSVSVWAAVRNRHRSLWLQLVTAAALGSSALLASVAATGRIASEAWWLWALSALHASGGVSLVRARLDARIAAAKERTLTRRYSALALSFVVTGAMVAIGLGIAGRPWLAGAAAFSAGLHAVELRTLADPVALATPLAKVGLRALAASVALTALLVAGLG